ncbi:hypothetical protein GF412_01285 [Candidatus Micrarchaeota archaeon]|nr:hypothetical protein [Candidatus Micrarchaeota archaeon]MBD3417604.1 hypothetical protein [Candidatus Micrarchaeota archaeon]
MNYKLLLLALVAFSFLLAGCGGKKAGEAQPQAPEEQAGEPAEEQQDDSGDEEEAESPPTDEAMEEDEEAEELANLFDIEINEPPGDFTYDKAPGEE